jgi:hypothetical protein
MFRIALVHKYETNLYAGDYSHGTFFEGALTVSTPEEVQEVVARFKDTGVLELQPCIDKYMSQKVASATTKLEFLNPDASKNFDGHLFQRGTHLFGDGFIYYDSKYHYRYYYWLEVSTLRA